MVSAHNYLVRYVTSCLLEEHTNTLLIGGEHCLNMQITQSYALYTKLCLQRSEGKGFH